MSAELLPCPMCGAKMPFTHITPSCAVLRCKCGLELNGGSVQVMYKRGTVPLALERYTYEPTLLVIRTADGDVPYPDHGYIGVNAQGAFHVYGHTARWNRRAA